MNESLIIKADSTISTKMLIIKTDSTISTKIESVVFNWMEVKKDGVSHIISAEVKIDDIPEELKQGWGAEWMLKLMGRGCMYLNLDPLPAAKEPEKKISIWKRIFK